MSLCPESGQIAEISGCPLCAISDRLHCGKERLYSITSSARASSVGGTCRPSMRAVWWLMTSSNIDDCRTVTSAGLAQLRTRHKGEAKGRGMLAGAETHRDGRA